MGPKEFAIRTNKPEKTINAVLKGDSSITPEMAVLFENVLQIPANYWLNRQRNYDEYLARLAAQNNLKKAVEWAKSFPLAELVKAGWIPAVKTIEEKAHALLSFFGFSNFETLFALLIQQHFHFDIKEGSYFFLFIGLVVAMVQGGMIGRLVKLFGEQRLIVLGCVIFSVSLMLIPCATRIWHLLAVLTGLGLGQGLNRSTILGLVSQQIGADEQGSVLGLAQSSGSLARILGPLAGGWFFDHLGAPVPFVLGGGLVLLTLASGFRFLIPERGSVPA